MTNEQKRHLEAIRAENWPPDTQSATEIIEDEIKRDDQSKRAGKLMDRLIREKNWKEVKKMAWNMYFSFGVSDYLSKYQ